MATRPDAAWIYVQPLAPARLDGQNQGGFARRALQENRIAPAQFSNSPLDRPQGGGAGRGFWSYGFGFHHYLLYAFGDRVSSSPEPLTWGSAGTETTRE